MSPRWSDSLAVGRKDTRGKRLLRGSKDEHEQLVESVWELAWYKFRVRLYRTDVVSGQTASGKFAPRAEPGLPDLAGAYLGRSIWIECKTGDNDSNSDQVRVQTQLVEDGALVAVVRNLTEAEAFLKVATRVWHAQPDSATITAPPSHGRK